MLVSSLVADFDLLLEAVDAVDFELFEFEFEAGQRWSWELDEKRFGFEWGLHLKELEEEEFAAHC